MSKNKFYILVGLLVGLKLIITIFLPIAADEAYYWVWGQNLQLSYFDHPPMVAWVSYLSQFIQFIPAWLSVRLFFFFLSLFTLITYFKIFQITQPEYIHDRKVQIFFLILFTLNPLSGFGSQLVTPDAPLLFFWGLSTYSFLNILQQNRLRDYILLGVFLGLGFCSKYHIVFFVLSGLISLILQKKWQLIKLRYALCTFLFGFVFSLPVLIWNYQNDFISFKFQLNHGLTSSSYEPWWTITYIIGQIFIFSPILFFDLITRLKTQLKTQFTTPLNVLLNMKSNPQSNVQLNIQLSVFQWLFFLASSFKAKVEANWPVTSHALALTALNFKNLKIIRYSIIYFLILYTTIPFVLLTNWGQKKINQLPTSYTINQLNLDVSQYQPLYASSYQLASLLYLTSNSPTYKLNAMSRYDFFDSLPQSRPKNGKIYALIKEHTSWPEYLTQSPKKLIQRYSQFQLELYEIQNE